MNILFLGDIVGRSGRDAAVKCLPKLRAVHTLDFIVVSGDNAAGGFGITPAICKELLTVADVVTGGDHIWDQKDIVPYLSQEKRLLRPANFPARAPGAGHGIFTSASGKKILVLHLLGQVFHKEHTECPFATADKILETVRLGGQVSAIIVDFHAEATSEKMAMAHHLDGRVSMVVGSHTHVPTADARIFPKGTAYQTDAGMCGDYHSIIGFSPEGPLERFLTKIPKAKMDAAPGEATLCGLLVGTEDATGLAKQCKAVQYPRNII
ncbi:MAG: YmdB family metallophosphoesterase [Pseudomonadota bacterium]|nr:YmdB family metallophosphoesterase [Pseudomonadota bacterium]MDE3038249.1 YmdB family metallophosphoesterase [Pseudomonadota bacterium]